MNYPNVKAVMLDATFDHVLPLAANVMPASWNSIVTTTVKVRFISNILLSYIPMYTFLSNICLFHFFFIFFYILFIVQPES
jgi:hypothetical protein